MSRHANRWCLPVALLLAALIAPAAAADAAAPQSDRFRDSAEGRAIAAAARERSPEQNYQQLLPLESRFAGDVDYDYLLGAAALDAGHASAAVFALQRAVASAPAYSGARLELARAYYAIGDNESARREFLTLQQERPPPAVAAAIAEYLDAIDRNAATYRPRYAAQIEAGGGYDSNANGATDARVFEGFDLNDRSRSQSSPYYGAGVSGQLSYPLAPRWRALGDVSALLRNFPRASFVDTTAARLGAGLEWDRDRLALTGVVSDTYVALDGRRNNTDLALDLSAVYGIAPAWQLGLGARAAALRFADALSTENVDNFLGSLALTRTWNSAPRLQLTAALAGGQDRPQEDNSPFGRHLFGGRLSAFVAPRGTVLLSASLAALRSDYEGSFFEEHFDDGTPEGITVRLDRRDTQYSARLGLDWKNVPARMWAIATQVTYIDNRSSLSLFEYDRVDLSVMLRREFR